MRSRGLPELEPEFNSEGPDSRAGPPEGPAPPTSVANACDRASGEGEEAAALDVPEAQAAVGLQKCPARRRPPGIIPREVGEGRLEDEEDLR